MEQNNSIEEQILLLNENEMQKATRVGTHEPPEHEQSKFPIWNCVHLTPFSYTQKS